MLHWINTRDRDIGWLIAKKQYRKACQVLRRQLARAPRSVHLRQRLADVLLLEKKNLEAMRILGRLAEELAADGFQNKAVAVLKKMQRINPSLRSLEVRIEALATPGGQLRAA